MCSALGSYKSVSSGGREYDEALGTNCCQYGGVTLRRAGLVFDLFRVSKKV